MRARTLAYGFSAYVLLATATALAGYQNLQHYPKDISSEDLKAEMNNLKKALGVDCGHCHQMAPKKNMAADTDTKKVSRYMLEMVDKLNKDCLNKTYLGIKDKDHQVTQATCFMCHRGKEKPELKADKADANKSFDESCKDDKHKAMAATMKKMVDKINKEYMASVQNSPKITCWTCHRGELEVKTKGNGD
jgi:hypothetical protein